MHHPTDRIAHTTAFVTPVVEVWLEREIAQWVHHEGSRVSEPKIKIATVQKFQIKYIFFIYDLILDI